MKYSQRLCARRQVRRFAHGQEGIDSDDRFDTRGEALEQLEAGFGRL